MTPIERYRHFRDAAKGRGADCGPEVLAMVEARTAHRAAQPPTVRAFREAMTFQATDGREKRFKDDGYNCYKHVTEALTARNHARRLAWAAPTCRRRLAGLLGFAPRAEAGVVVVAGGNTE